MSTKVSRFFVNWLQEPLVHFLVIGAGFFLYWHFFGEARSSNPERVVITQGQVERLVQAWTKTRLRPPTAAELAQVIEQEIDEEILYREAMALGLDREDAVIRKRMAVKMDFLTEDAAAEIHPSEEQLASYLQQHPQPFATDALTSFDMIFISRAQGAAGADAEAQRLLTLLADNASPDWSKLGDPLPMPNSFTEAPATEIGKILGREFPKKLIALPVGRWSGPIESNFGLHLIRVTSRSGGKTPQLAEVREAVLNAWRSQQRESLAETLRRQRRARYSVSVQWPDWAKELMPHAAVSPEGLR